MHAKLRRSDHPGIPPVSTKCKPRRDSFLTCRFFHRSPHRTSATPEGTKQSSNPPIDTEKDGVNRGAMRNPRRGKHGGLDWRSATIAGIAGMEVLGRTGRKARTRKQSEAGELQARKETKPPAPARCFGHPSPVSHPLA